jgi:flagellar biosynthesis activator protein FlaF
MSRGVRHYQNPLFQAASSRETEIVAFSLCNNGLETAISPAERIHALYKNQQLWSALVKDVSLEANGLPAPIKKQITELGDWAMRYSTIAMTSELSLAPLVQVNQDMIDGLRGQAGMAQPPAPAADQGAQSGGKPAEFGAALAI